jgi:thioredoxin 1
MCKIIAVATAEEAVVDSQKKRNLALKIILPIVVVAVIAGIWFFKTNGKPLEILDSSSSVTVADDLQETTISGSTSSTIDNQKEKVTTSSSESKIDGSQQQDSIDFSLAVSEIDLEKLKSYGLPFMIDFGADSCIPCKEMAPVLEKLNEEWQGKVIVKFADVWKYPDAAAEFPVQVIPTQFFFDGQGKPYIPSDPEGMQMIMYYLKDTQEHIYTAHQGGMTEEQIKAAFKEMGIE